MAFENFRADLRAYQGHWGAQGLWVMAVYRFNRWRYGVRVGVLRRGCSLMYRLLYKLVQLLTGIELPCESELGRNFLIGHFGGIVISGYAKVGDDCRIRTGVVVGLARIDDPRAPIISNDADIGWRQSIRPHTHWRLGAHRRQRRRAVRCAVRLDRGRRSGRRPTAPPANMSRSLLAFEIPKRRNAS